MLGENVVKSGCELSPIYLEKTCSGQKGHPRAYPSYL